MQISRQFMAKTIIENARIVSETGVSIGSVLIEDGKISATGTGFGSADCSNIIDADGMLLMPGIIDDQVHFREPGGTAKADIRSESAAAVAGGTTSIMDMPNTNPQTVTIERWQEKNAIAAASSNANYAFFLGATNDNLEELKKLDQNACPGVKVFMGSSTGNMLVDSESSLDAIFALCPPIIATHCESTPIITQNELKAKERFGDDVPVSMHPLIRSREACIESSKLAISLAERHGSNLHLFHLSTKEEAEMLAKYAVQPFSQRKITGEACAPHIAFTDSDYAALGTKIKCNPAVKTEEDRDAILKALKSDVIGIVATDHAPHLASEKANSYFKAPSGIPMCQHTMQLMLELVADGVLELKDVARLTAFNPAVRYKIADRGRIVPGCWADLVLVDDKAPDTISKSKILYKCGWSPFEGKTFSSTIIATFVNGVLACEGGRMTGEKCSMALSFAR